jgi:hemerythrin-like domain-containing protein
MKRHKSLFSLSHEHQHGLALALKLKYPKRQLSSSNEAEISELKSELADKYENILRKHFRKEERYLVPGFEDNNLMKQMLGEHIKLEGLYNKIVSNSEGWKLEQQRDMLNLFGELLDLHIRFEERELFPMIEKSLSEEQLEELGKMLGVSER